MWGQNIFCPHHVKTKTPCSRAAGGFFPGRFYLLVPVCIRLERSFNLHADVLSLLFIQGVKLHTNLAEVETRYFLIEKFRKHIYFFLVFAMVGPKLELCE